MKTRFYLLLILCVMVCSHTLNAATLDTATQNFQLTVNDSAQISFDSGFTLTQDEFNPRSGGGFTLVTFPTDVSYHLSNTYTTGTFEITGYLSNLSIIATNWSSWTMTIDLGQMTKTSGGTGNVGSSVAVASVQISDTVPTTPDVYYNNITADSTYTATGSQSMTALEITDASQFTSRTAVFTWTLQDQV